MSVRTCGLLLVFVLVLLTADSSPLPNNGGQNEALDIRPPRVSLCSASATRCWAQGSLLDSHGGCFAPLTRGPCPAGQWWLLGNGSDAGAWGQCASMTCPPDARSAECRRVMQQTAEACPRRPDGASEFAVYMDPAGDFRCGVFPGRAEALRELVRCRPLDFPRNRHSFAVNANGRQCAQNDRGQCMEVQGDPQPVITFNAEE